MRLVSDGSYLSHPHRRHHTDYTSYKEGVTLIYLIVEFIISG